MCQNWKMLYSRMKICIVTSHFLLLIEYADRILMGSKVLGLVADGVECRTELTEIVRLKPLGSRDKLIKHL